jgi:CMP-N-acetylneuraminic acid synthetase
LRALAGKPLIAHTIEQAIASAQFDTIAVSSDSPEILDVAAAYHVDLAVRRPDHLATDAAAKAPAIAHCVLEAEKKTGRRYAVIVELQATSPLREPADIAGAIALLERTNVSSVVSGTPSRHSPYFSVVERDAEGFVRLSKTVDRPLVRRQDAPECFDLNGSIYVWRRDIFLSRLDVLYPDTLLYPMPAERSVDIDDELDWRIAAMLLDHAKAGDR